MKSYIKYDFGVGASERSGRGEVRVRRGTRESTIPTHALTSEVSRMAKGEVWQFWMTRGVASITGDDYRISTVSYTRVCTVHTPSKNVCATS